MRSGGVWQVVDRLRADLAELVAVDPAGCSDQDLREALRALHPVLCQAQAVVTGLVGAAHRRGAATVEGAASTQAWLRNRLRMGDAGAQIRVATALERLPHLAEAYQRGDVS